MSCMLPNIDGIQAFSALSRQHALYPSQAGCVIRKSSGAHTMVSELDARESLIWNPMNAHAHMIPLSGFLGVPSVETTALKT